MDFTLKNKNGTKVIIDSYGATIKDIIFDGESMICDAPYSASVIGRIAGRITGGKFNLLGEEINVTINKDTYQLHGNHEFDRNDWGGTSIDNSVVLKFYSKDGSNGFKGNLEVIVTYTLSDDDELHLDYYAKTDKATILNLTNHAYFNLNGGKEPALSHVIKANAKYFAPLNEDLTPSGNLLETKDTIFDIKEGKMLKDVVESSDSQVLIAKNGYDHAFVFEDCKDFNLYTNDKIHEATLRDTDTNRVVTMKTDYPCFVCYTGNQMETPHKGICLEAQLLPDAINHEGFGDIVLYPDKPFNHFVSYKFEKVQ